MRRVAARTHRECRRSGPRIFTDVAPLVAVEDRRDEETNGYARSDRTCVERPGHRVKRPDHHQRSHEEKDDRDADRPELVLERRSRIGVSPDEADDPQDDDRQSADEREHDPHQKRDRECGDREAVCVAIADAALHDRVARARRHDRVDALAHVVDLVGDIRPHVERDGADERREEEERIEGPGERREGAARRDGDGRGGERERPRDLPQRSHSIRELRARRFPLRRERFARSGADFGGPVERRGLQERGDLRFLLHDRLQQRQIHAGLVIGRGTLGDFALRTAEDVRVEKLVGDEGARAGVVLRAPCRSDPVAHLGLEAGAAKRDVRKDRHHVDDERVAFRAVQRVATRLVDECEEVSADVDGLWVAPGFDRRALHHPEELAKSPDRLGRTREVTIALPACDDHHRRAVAGDIDRYAVDRREHRLERRKPGLAGGHPLAAPQRVQRVDRRRGARRGIVRGVGDAHLAEAKWERRAEAEADPCRCHLVEGADGHGDEHRVAREWIERPKTDADLIDLRCDRARVADRVALEVAVVEPDRLQTRRARPLRPPHGVLH